MRFGRCEFEKVQVTNSDGGIVNPFIPVLLDVLLTSWLLPEQFSTQWPLTPTSLCHKYEKHEL